MNKGVRQNSTDQASEFGSSFSVVSMMREEPFVIQWFIDFYIKAGASRIFIYYDGVLQHQEDIPGLSRPEVELTECDDTFWVGVDCERPACLEDAQAAVFRLAHHRCLSDWLLIVDADEFVVGARSIKELLSSVPDAVKCIRVRSAEAIWGPGDDIIKEFGCTHFRTILPRRASALLSWILYGNNASLFRQGLLSHTEGKQFLRRSAKVSRIGIHNSYIEQRSIGQWVHELSPNNVSFILAHFDAIGFIRWRKKWEWRLTGKTNARDMSSQRVAQMRRIEESLISSDIEIEKTFRSMNTITRWQRLLLNFLGRIERRQIFGDGR